jgi:aryl-alcohol dehydrogenase-like predicted oxidoreductase
METRRIGGSDGIDITVVGLGCNAFGRRLDDRASRPVIHGALDAGINFFDTADGYGNGQSEGFIGRALEGHRQEVVLATKFGLGIRHAPGKALGSRENAMAAIETSLRNLRTDYIDLWQLHRPDPSTPIAETLAAMNDMVEAGKVRHIGCSNFSPAQMTETIAVARDLGIKGFVTAQNEWSVLDREIEGELVPVCAQNDIGILPYYPLARGLLTGKYRRGERGPAGSRLEGGVGNADFDTLEALEAFATARGYDLLTLAVSWLVANPATASVIAGATRAEQLVQNVAAARWKMMPEDLAEIDRIVGNS